MFNQIAIMEDMYARRPDIRMAVSLALRLWLVYAVAAVSEPAEYLHRAYQVVLPLLRKNSSDLRLCWASIFFAIEQNYFDRANEMLDDAYAYRNYYKSKDPFHYKVLLYLYAYLEIKQKRTKSAGKHMRALEAVYNGSPTDALLLGMLHLKFNEYDEAYQLLMRSFDGGCRSVFLFNALFTYYKMGTKTNIITRKESVMLLQTVHWALNHGADVENIIMVYQNELLPEGPESSQIALAERIYRLFPNQWVLKKLCVYYMSRSDYGPKAYGYYRDAERRQVLLQNLSCFLVRAAFENGSEKVHHYTMTQYLRKPANGDMHLMVYVYHLLLTDPNLSDLAQSKVDEMLQMAVHCLQNDIRGRHANSLYYFYWIKSKNDADKKKAEKILLEDLCKFEITDPKKEVHCLYVNEWERRGITQYEFPQNGSPLIINAVGSGFRYTGLSAGRVKVLDNRLEIRRMVASAAVSIYRHFYDSGLRSFEIIAYLAKSQQGDAEILEAVLAEPEASRAFKTQCSVALGRLHYERGDIDLALEYYSKADENALDDDFLEHMLAAYVRQRSWKQAAGLVKRKWNRMNDKALLSAVKSLAAKECAEWHLDIVNAAYELLLRFRYDKNLLEVVLQHYAGTQEEWLALSSALSAVSVYEPRLDELILKNAAWAHHFDENTQKVFVRSASGRSAAGERSTADGRPAANDNRQNSDFIYYAIYEMIIGKVKPLAETVAVLERIYEKSKDCLLALGLSYVYLGHDINTMWSDTIIQEALSAQQEKGILFPIFKASKKIANTYIEKYRPFMYKTLPGKDVKIYYKVNGEPEGSAADDWQAKTMEYWRFGLYMTCVPHFYNESLTYYFSEELATGSITTREEEVHNGDIFLDDNQSDLFFVINNATIYEQMFRYEQVEEIISKLVKDVRIVRSKLL